MPRRTHGLSPGAAARLFHTLGSETRLRLVLLLAGRGEVSVGDLGVALAVTQPAVSQHLRVLRAAGVAECRKRYSPRPGVVIDAEDHRAAEEAGDRDE